MNWKMVFLVLFINIILLSIFIQRYIYKPEPVIINKTYNCNDLVAAERKVKQRAIDACNGTWKGTMSIGKPDPADGRFIYFDCEPLGN